MEHSKNQTKFILFTEFIENKTKQIKCLALELYKTPLTIRYYLENYCGWYQKKHRILWNK